MTITRYNIGTRHHNGIGFPGEMVKLADGEYVRYADHAAIIAESQAEKAGLESVVAAQAETITRLRGATIATQEPLAWAAYDAATGKPVLTTVDMSDSIAWFPLYRPTQPPTSAQPDHSEDVRAMVGAQVSELDALGEQCNRLQDALAFYMPDVPEEGHPLHKRIAQDAYLLCGYDGSGEEEPSAHALGLISLSAQPAEPVKEPSDSDIPDIAQRILRYAGKTRRQVSNPCITAREAIALADWIVGRAAPTPAADGQENNHGA